MSNLGKISFSLAGQLSRVYSFKSDDGSSRFAASVDFWGSSVTVFVSPDVFSSLQPLAGSADVRVLGYIVKDKSGGFRLQALAVDFPGCENWSDVQPAELAAGVQFTGTCRVKTEPRRFKRRDGSDDVALDCDLFGSSVTFSGFSPSLVEGLTTAQLIQVNGTAEPITFRGADGKENQNFRLHLLTVRKLRAKE